MYEVKPDVLKYMLDHVVFPVKLPQSSEPIAAVSDRHAFLLVVDEVINALCSEHTKLAASVELQRVAKLARMWRRLQYDTAATSFRIDERLLHESICSLKESESLALYMPTQNACLLITRSDSGSPFQAVVSYFHASHANQIIMSSNDDSLERIVPDASFRVADWSVVNAASFAQLLADLSSDFETHGTSSKCGLKQTEVRDVSSPGLIVDWLMHALVGNETMPDVDEKPVKIKKRVRDDILWSDCLLPFRRSPMWTCIKCVLHLEVRNRFGEHFGLIVYKTIVARVLDELCRHSYTANSDDLNKQMIRKLARRLYKLNNLHKMYKLHAEHQLIAFDVMGLIDSKHLFTMSKC